MRTERHLCCDCGLSAWTDTAVEDEMNRGEDSSGKEGMSCQGEYMPLSWRADVWLGRPKDRFSVY